MYTRVYTCIGLYIYIFFVNAQQHAYILLLRNALEHVVLLPFVLTIITLLHRDKIFHIFGRIVFLPLSFFFYGLFSILFPIPIFTVLFFFLLLSTLQFIYKTNFYLISVTPIPAFETRRHFVDLRKRARNFRMQRP